VKPSFEWSRTTKGQVNSKLQKKKKKRKGKRKKERKKAEYEE
jgi:hypothetical protein